jgi:hypothetical protein
MIFLCKPHFQIEQITATIHHTGKGRIRSEAFQRYLEIRATDWIPAFAGMTLIDSLK